MIYEWDPFNISIKILNFLSGFLHGLTLICCPNVTQPYPCLKKAWKSGSGSISSFILKVSYYWFYATPAKRYAGEASSFWWKPQKRLAIKQRTIFEWGLLPRYTFLSQASLHLLSWTLDVIGMGSTRTRPNYNQISPNLKSARPSHITNETEFFICAQNLHRINSCRIFWLLDGKRF